MKIGLLFAGRIKTFEECYDSLKFNILEQLKEHEIDSFLSHNIINKNDDIKKFINLYNVKLYEETDMNDTSYYEKKIILNNNNGARWTSILMYYNIYNAFNLMEKYSIENNIKYDIIIYLRADMIFKTPLIINRIIEENTVYIPNINDWAGINDQFAYGNFETMKKYCSLYLNVEDYYNKTNIKFHTETYVKIHINEQNLNLVRFDLNYDLHPKRQY